MKITEINILIFEALDTIAKNHGIKDIVWAQACGLQYSPRISELRRKLVMTHTGKDQTVVGRSFNIVKCAALVDGLKKLIGGREVKKELFELTKKLSNRQQRLLMMCLALDEEEEEQAELFLKALFRVTPS